MNFRSCRGFISFKESIWSESSWGESMNGMDSPIQAFFGSPASSWERLSPSSGNVRLWDPCDWQVRFPLEERQERCCLTQPPPLAHFSVQHLNGQAVSAQACSPTQQQPLMPPSPWNSGFRHERMFALFWLFSYSDWRNWEGKEKHTWKETINAYKNHPAFYFGCLHYVLDWFVQGQNQATFALCIGKMSTVTGFSHAW